MKLAGLEIKKNDGLLFFKVTWRRLSLVPWKTSSNTVGLHSILVIGEVVSSAIWYVFIEEWRERYSTSLYKYSDWPLTTFYYSSARTLVVINILTTAKVQILRFVTLRAFNTSCKKLALTRIVPKILSNTLCFGNVLVSKVNHQSFLRVTLE